MSFNLYWCTWSYIILEKSWYSYTPLPILIKHSHEPPQGNWLSNEKTASKLIRLRATMPQKDKHIQTDRHGRQTYNTSLFTSGVRNTSFHHIEIGISTSTFVSLVSFYMHNRSVFIWICTESIAKNWIREP